MIHDEIVGYEVCKLAKEKGFPQKASRWRKSTSPSRNYYNHKGELNGDCLEIIKCICRKEEVPIELQTIAAPTQSRLQRWLREEKGIHISVEYEWVENFDGWTFWAYIKQVKDERVINDAIKSGFNTYELALEDALAYSLKNLV